MATTYLAYRINHITKEEMTKLVATPNNYNYLDQEARTDRALTDMMSLYAHLPSNCSNLANRQGGLVGYTGISI